MPVPIITFPLSLFPWKATTGSKSATAELRTDQKNTKLLRVADAIDQLTTGVNALENAFRSCRVADEAWFKIIGIGGTGYNNAPFKVDVNGDLTILNALITMINGTKSIVINPTVPSITLQDTAAGVDSIATLATDTITIAPYSGGPPVLRLEYDQASGHAYIQTEVLSGATTLISGILNSDGLFSLATDTGTRIEQRVYSATLTNENWWYRSRGNYETKAAVQVGDVLSRFQFNGYHTASAASEGARIEVVASSVAAGGIGGRIGFNTYVAGTGGERLAILENGVVNPSYTVYVTGAANPTSGSGLNLAYSGGDYAQVFAYKWSAVTGYKPLRLDGLHTIINYDSAGNLLIRTDTNNTDGGVIQINGDCTPDVDQGGDLGTANVQWDDIRFKGKLIQNTTDRIDASGNAVFASYSVGATPGIDQVVALAKLTPAGADGSATFTKGILTAYTAPT